MRVHFDLSLYIFRRLWSILLKTAEYSRNQRSNGKRIAGSLPHECETEICVRASLFRAKNKGRFKVQF